MSGIVRAFPLSPLQEGILYHAVRHPESRLYRGHLAAEFEGPLRMDAFEAAWARAADRHEAFRTFFAWERRERPLQVVREVVELPFRWLDWSGLGAGDVEARWAVLMEEERNAPLTLDTAPLMRFTVARTGPERHRLLWLSHHAVLDGWSGELVLSEVLDDLAGRPLPSTPSPSYAEFVGWIESRDAAEAEAWWRRELEGCPEPTPLPAAVGEGDSLRRASVRRGLPTLRPTDVRDALARLRVTPATLTVGAWALVLARTTGHRDLLFGITASERPAEITAVERAAGLYLSTLPVRVRIDAPMSASRWLAMLQTTLAEARSRGFPGLGAIRRWAGLQGTGPIRSLVVFENFPASVDRSDRPGRVRLRSIRARSPSEFPVALLGHPGEALEIELEYDPAGLSEAGATALLDDVLGTLEALLTSSEPLATLLGEVGFDEGPALDAQPVDVMSAFRDRVAGDPTAPALRTATDTWSYRDLDRQSAALARGIAAAVAPGAVVGLVAERGPEAVVGMLAALRAGAAYLPLDPEMPVSRLEGILEAADAVVAHPRLDGVAPGLRRISPAGDTAVDLPTRIPPEAPAYVIFTSGSTGTPKGVVVERRQLAWSTAARFAVYDEHPGVFLLLSPLSVDSSVAGIWWTLCAGGTLVLPGARAEQDVADLCDLLAGAGVTHTLLVPSLWGTILDEAEPSALASLRQVVVAGEACPGAVVRRHRAILPGVPLHNEYGPSEATVWATVADLTADADVTIGRAVPGARIAVVDDGLRTVPAGTPGELVIGGAGVTRGYLGRPDLTAERFVTDPGRTGQVVYRTGDRARRLPDGRFDFLGRMDHQLKVRGHRVEAGEVEAALRGHESVSEAVVDLSPGGTPSPDANNIEALADALLDLDVEARRRLLAHATESP